MTNAQSACPQCLMITVDAGYNAQREVIPMKTTSVGPVPQAVLSVKTKAFVFPALLNCFLAETSAVSAPVPIASILATEGAYPVQTQAQTVWLLATEPNAAVVFTPPLGFAFLAGRDACGVLTTRFACNPKNNATCSSTPSLPPSLNIPTS